MPNKTIQIDKPNIKEDMEYLINFLSEKVDYQTPHEYFIGENFPLNKPSNYEPNVYRLYNITAELEDDGVVHFDDGEGILEEAMYNNTPLPFQAFSLDSIIYIGFQTLEDKITISFETGYIFIFY